MIIIHKGTFKQENQIVQLSTDPTESFQEQIQQKHLIQIKPMAPKLNALIKTQKEYKPIRPATNNIQAPYYKLAKYLN